MFEAIDNTYKHFDFGNVQRTEDDHVVTESGVWCHVLSTKRMLELQEKELGTVNYVPSPCLYVKSSIEKSRQKFCLVLADEDLTETSKKICSYFSEIGLPSKKINDSVLHPKERLRAFKEASFIVAQNCNDVLAQLSLCSSGTPFVLLDEPTPVLKDFVEMANVREVLSSDLETVREVYHNSSAFSSLVEAVLVELKNLRTWQKSIHVFPRGNGKLGNKNIPFSFDPSDPSFATFSYGPGIYFSLDPYETFARKKSVVMCPWIGYFNFNPLELDAFNVSLITCMGIITETQGLADIIRRHVGDIPVSILPLPKREFKLEEWKMKAKITCKDGVVVSSDLSTLSGKLSKTKEYENEILVFENVPENYEDLISRGIPFVCPSFESRRMNEYPGFCDTKLTPSTVSKFLTKSKVEEMVTFLLELQAEDYLKSLKETSVWAKCVN